MRLSIAFLCLVTSLFAASCLVTTGRQPSTTTPPVATNQPEDPIQPRYVEGAITDAVTRLPVARAAIDITAPSTGKVEFTTTTDAAGNYRTGELPPGPFNIRVRREGYQPLTRAANVTNGPARLDVALVPSR